MVNPLSNPSYLIPPLIAVAISFPLAFLVLRKDPKVLANRLLALLLVSLGFWGFFVYLMRSSPDVEHALSWNRMVFPSGFALFIFYYHFTCAYTRVTPKKLLWAAYSVLIIVCILSAANLLFSHITLESYGYAPHFYPSIYIISASGSLFLVMGLWNFIKAFRGVTRYEEKTRLAYMIAAILILLILGIVDFSPNLPPIGLYGNILFGTITAVAILKYHLLDINIVIRKGSAYLLMSVLIAIPYGGIVIGISMGLHTQFPLWGYILMVVFLAFIIAPLWQRVQDWVDRLFYRERYDYLKGLEEFGQQMISIIELESLASSTIDMITKAMQVKNACLMMPTLETGDYTVVASKGLPDFPIQHMLKGNNPLVRWLEREKKYLQNREIDVMPRLLAMGVNELEVLRQLEGELYIPLNVQDRLVGIMVLGRKLSQQLFTTRDLQLLSTVSTQIAVSLENARLYQREKQRAGELAMLYQSSAKLASELDLNLLYQKITEETAKLLQADTVVFLNINDDNRTLSFQASTGLSTINPQGIELPVPQDIPEELSNYLRPENEVFIINDVNAHPVKRIRFFQLEQIRSVLGIPITESGKLISAIVIFAKKTPRRFTDEEVNMALTFARNAALAIENAHLYGIERKQRLELERLDEMRSNFFIAVSHELKTPLTAIKGAGEIILDSQGVDLDSPEGELFSIINRNVQRMENRIQELLDFVKIQSDTLQLELKAEDINQVIEEVATVNLPTLWSRKQTLETDLLGQTTTVMLDHNRFEQILANLISNASKYSPQGSEITVETRIEDSQVIIDVSDQGRGVPPEFREKIFESYFRVENNTSGLGIGLSIAKKLTELHGGQMWVNDREGGGSTFSFSLPIEQN